MSGCECCGEGSAEHRVTGYGVAVCDPCWRAAARGWPRTFEPALKAGLAREGRFVPDRNAAGLLPREYAAPRDFPI